MRGKDFRIRGQATVSEDLEVVLASVIEASHLLDSSPSGPAVINIQVSSVEVEFGFTEFGANRGSEGPVGYPDLNIIRLDGFMMSPVSLSDEFSQGEFRPPTDMVLTGTS